MTVPTGSGRRCASLLALALLAAACQGQIVPLSAQQGTTILIPLQSGDPFATGLVGFGGAEVVDYQRGAFRFRLDDSSGPILETRGASIVAAHPASAHGRGESLAPGVQLVALVNIPSDAPLGTHAIHISRVRIEDQQEVEYTSALQYPGLIKILPNEIEVDLAGGGTEIVTGAETPFEARFGSFWTPANDYVPLVVPDPQVRITLTQAVWAAELTIAYPDDVIDVKDVLEPPGLRTTRLASVWFDELPPNGSVGTVVARIVGGGAALSAVSLVFTLDDGAEEILDPGDIDVTIDKAFDYSGSPVSIGVASKTIE